MTVERHFISTVFVIKEGKVLFTWNNKVNNWIPIGGHIDENEYPCDSVIREAKEESNLDIELINPFTDSEDNELVQPVHMRIDHIKDNHKHINLMYWGIVSEDSAKCFEIDDEGKELKWFSLEEVEKLENMIPNVKEWSVKALKALGDKY